MVLNNKALVFHMFIICGKTFSLVQRSMLSVSVMVKYQGHNFSKKKKKK